MSLYGYSGGPLSAAKESCRPDYAKMAERLNRQIKVLGQYEDATKSLIEMVGIHYFETETDRKTILAILGHLSMEIPKLLEERDRCIEKIQEKEQG